MGPAEARSCESASQRFKGLCVRNSNCASICNTEGFPDGHCKGFRRHGTKEYGRDKDMQVTEPTLQRAMLLEGETEEYSGSKSLNLGVFLKQHRQQRPSNTLVNEFMNENRWNTEKLLDNVPQILQQHIEKIKITDTTKKDKCL
ncbi:hypothetical protein RND71_002460 [Anisodus tanguticus]|uniref:Knottins-like domain-containing protein n=1 Tax=Anisodus tanguticus TaxID=243964 RepID=A0AAE1T302_9SOLA|nr:hypothetical protein RND71_002460 [Anisodus tanguticus]